MSDCTGCQNLSNLIHQGNREMCRIVQDVRTCLIRHNKGPGKCVGLYRMSKYSGFILVNRNTLGPKIFVGCHRMSENSGVRLHKFHCITYFEGKRNLSLDYNLLHPMSEYHYQGPLVQTCRPRLPTAALKYLQLQAILTTQEVKNR